MKIWLATFLIAIFALAASESRGGEIILKTYYDSDGKAVSGYAYQSSKTWRYRRAARYYNSGYVGGYYGGFTGYSSGACFSPPFHSHGLSHIPTAPTVRPSIAPTLRPSVAPTVRAAVVPTVRPNVAVVRPNPIPTRPALAPLTRPTLAPAIRPSLAPTVRPSLDTGIRPSTVRPTPGGTTTVRVYKRPTTR